MMLQSHAKLLLAGLASGWLATGVASPAIAQDRTSAVVAGGAPLNQGPHSFGDTMASGNTEVAPTMSRSYYNQGPHNFSDPTASGRLAIGPTPTPYAANPGPHAF